jgi:hypothetical protein
MLLAIASDLTDEQGSGKGSVHNPPLMQTIQASQPHHSLALKRLQGMMALC